MWEGPGPGGKVQVHVGGSTCKTAKKIVLTSSVQHVKQQSILKNMFSLQVSNLKNMYFCSWLFARPLVPVTVDQYQRIWLFGLFVHGAGRNM